MGPGASVLPAGPTVPVLYAFTLGLVAAVNPCGFPMLPAYLAVFTRPVGDPSCAVPLATRISRGLLAGAGVSAGFVAVFGVLGLLLEGGARMVTDWLPWIMIAMGITMSGGGVATLLGRAPTLGLAAPRFRTQRSVLAMAAYGMAYATGSLSCSLPLFLAAVAGSFTGQGFRAGLSTYLAYALGMGLFVTAAAVITTTLGAAAVRRLRSVTRWLPAVSGVTLALSGAYLAYYWASELLDPAGASPVTLAVGAVQGWLAAAIAARPLLTAALLGAVVLAAITAVALRTLKDTPDTEAEAEAEARKAHPTS